jgi:hypothetical protein
MTFSQKDAKMISNFSCRFRASNQEQNATVENQVVFATLLTKKLKKLLIKR